MKRKPFKPKAITLLLVSFFLLLSCKEDPKPKKQPTPSSPEDLVFEVDAGNTLSFKEVADEWNDLTSNAHKGTLINGPTFDPTNSGSIYLDGVDDYVDFGDTNLSIQDDASELTLEAWVYPLNFNSFGGILVRSSGVSPYGGWQLNFNNSGGINRFDFAVNVNGVWRTWITEGGTYSTALNTNTWYHVVGVFDGSSLSMYINGNLAETVALPAPGSIKYTKDQKNLFIGKNPVPKAFTESPQYANCKIAIARVYKKALPASEIFENFENYKTRFN